MFRLRNGILLLVGGLLFLVFLLFQARTIPAGDSGDLVTAAYLFGVPHPPGYPLYTFLAWLLTKLPVSSIAFRVGLLSSLPHAVTAAMAYAIVYRMTKNTVSALFSVLVLFGNYLFFLYSVTPEVFALFDLFTILIFYLLFLFRESKHIRFFYLTCVIFGLSLAHHQVILFFVPACIYFFWRERKLFARTVSRIGRFRFIGRSCLLILLGLLPYLYVPIAARHVTIINWNRAVDFTGFLRLLTRADYGTFQSGSAYAQLLSERLLEVKAWGRFVVLDLTLVGIVLAVFGAIWLYRRYRTFAITLLLALLFVGPGFFFYAGFPLVNQFMLGTYERFLLPSYTILSLFIGLGFFYALELMKGVSRKLSYRRLQTALFKGTGILFFLYPVLVLSITLSRFSGYAHDMTAQNLGTDVLTTVPDHALVLLSRDTTLFTVQYVRYVLNVRPDTIVLQVNSLGAHDYRQVIADVFPQLILPSSTGNQFFGDFVTQNSKKFPILTNTTMLPIPAGWVSVPYGLLSRLVPSQEAPSASDLKAENGVLWKNYHDPTGGILARQNHLMLSDVLDVYTSARMRYGTVLLKAGEYEGARDEFREAVRLGGDIQIADAYTSLGLTELWLTDCTGALDAFQKAREVTRTQNKEIFLYEAMVYRDCVKDEARARALFDEYERLSDLEKTPLQSL